MFGKKKKKDAAEGAEGPEGKEEEKKEAEKPAEGADGAEGAEGAEGEGGKKSKKKLIIIAVAAVVLIAGGGAGAYFGGLIGGKEHAAEGEATAEGAEGEGGGEHGKKGEGAGPVYMELPEFLVNLNTSGRQSSFLKMTVSLELSSPEDQAVIEANMPKILDTFNTYLRELRASDLYGSAGIYRLREELMGRINKIVAPVTVKDILFKQVLVQ